MIQGLQTGGNMSRKPRVARSPEEKWQIVQEGIKSRNVSETCRRHGIAANLFYRWKDEAEQGAKAALGGKSAAAAETEKAIVSGNWNARWGGSRWRSKS
jgi:transposase-like protein